MEDKARNAMPVDDDDDYDETKVMQVFGVHQPITFYGFMNMKASIDFPDVNSDEIIDEILSEKRKRIQ